MNLYIFENLGGKAVIIQQRSAIEKSIKGLFLRFSRKPTGSCIGNHYDAIVDIETIPFHPLVATAETTTSILSGTKSEPSQLHPKSKQHLPNLPPLPEPELEPEQQQEFQIKLEPTEPKPEFVPEEGFETKVEPTEPKPEFVPEEGFETKVEPTVPKTEFTIPNTARFFCSQFGGVLVGSSLLLFLLSVFNFLGNVVRVYPKIVQGLTFLSA